MMLLAEKDPGKQQILEQMPLIEYWHRLNKKRIEISESIRQNKTAGGKRGVNNNKAGIRYKRN